MVSSVNWPLYHVPWAGLAEDKRFVAIFVRVLWGLYSFKIDLPFNVIVISSRESSLGEP